MPGSASALPDPVPPPVEVVGWGGAARRILDRLSACGSDLDFVGCRHGRRPADPRELHLEALSTVLGPSCRAGGGMAGAWSDGPSDGPLSATSLAVTAGELFGWAYDRSRQRLLRVADGPVAEAAEAQRWLGRAAPGYGPFSWGDGEELVWIEDLSSPSWGFTCLLLQPGLGPTARQVEHLVALVDSVVLGAPGEGCEAFRWDIDGMIEHAWTVRTGPERLVVVCDVGRRRRAA